MNATKVSAQFAAFMWFTNRDGNKPAKSGQNQEAWAYARQNWQNFLPNAHEGLGRLLLKMADGARRPSLKRARPELAAAS